MVVLGVVAGCSSGSALDSSSPTGATLLTSTSGVLESTTSLPPDLPSGVLEGGWSQLPMRATLFGGGGIDDVTSALSGLVSGWY